MTTDPCPQCRSRRTVLVPPAIAAVVAQRCTDCGARWSVPLTVGAAVHLDAGCREGDR